MHELYFIEGTKNIEPEQLNGFEYCDPKFYPEFQEKIELLNLEHDFEILKSEIKNKQSGSEILFKGLKTSSGDQTANLKSLQGVTTWILDEAEELVDEKTFDKINLSIRQK